MRTALLEGLGLAGRQGDLVGTALLARAAAIQVRRSEGTARRMQDLASLSIGVMAILDAEVTGRASAGMARALDGVPSALGAITGGIAVAAGRLEPSPLPGPETDATAPLGWEVFRLLQSILAPPDLRTDPYYIAGRTRPELLFVSGRDEGQPVGRLGISAFRWMLLAATPHGPARSAAAWWILNRGAEEVDRTMQDSFHWKNLHSGLAPVEPELLLTGLILLQNESYGLDRRDVYSDAHPVARATLASAADILGLEGIAEDLGGEATRIEGEAGSRWSQWLDTIREGPIDW